MISDRATITIAEQNSPGRPRWFEQRYWGSLIVCALSLTSIAASANAQVFGPPGVMSNTIPSSDFEDDFDPRVISDGAGTWVAVWSTDDSLGGTIGLDRDILMSRSVDDGASWSAPVALDQVAAIAPGADFDPQLTTDGAGNWVAVWISTSEPGGGLGDWDVLVSRSADNGATWSAAAAIDPVLATSLGHHIAPQVSTDGAGNWITVWQTSVDVGGTLGTDNDILVSRSIDNGASWSAAAALNSNAALDSGSDERPQLSADGVGNWVVVWQSEDPLGGTIGTDADILVSRSADNGLSWSAPAALNSNAATDAGNDEHPQVSTGASGNWVAVWQSNDDLVSTIGSDLDLLIARSSDAGASWSAPAALNAGADVDSWTDSSPQIGTDAAGNWVAVWYSGESSGPYLDGNIAVAHSTDDGLSWTVPTQLNSNVSYGSASDIDPHVATDGAGNWVAVWRSWDDLGGTIGGDYDIFVARSSDIGQTWSAADVLNSNAAADAVDQSPQLATDGGGNWVAVWQSEDTLQGTIGDDRDVLLARSTDNGATWTAPAALNANAVADTGDDVSPQVTTDGLGNWVAVWQSEENVGGALGPDHDILIARSTDNGVSWTAPVALNTNGAADSGDDIVPQVTTDGLGNWIAVWQSDDELGIGLGTDLDILVARSTDDGATWTAPVALNSTAATDSGHDVAPRVSTDGWGNWVAVWYSEDDLGGTIGTDADILVSRSTDNGASWSTVAALNSDADQLSADYLPQVTTEGAGNWVAVWYSSGSSLDGNDIRVSRSTDNGATWSAIAALAPDSTAFPASDFRPQVATDGAGNWVAVWYSTDDLGGTITTALDILISRSIDNGVSWSAPEALTADAAADPSNDFSPQVATDGAGNWVVVWYSDDSLGGVASHGVKDVFFATASIVCGDASIASAEQCDDGNAGAGDGCDASCQVEEGYYCELPGFPCEMCTACAVGEYESTTCSTTADTVCTACTVCADGTYESTVCAGAGDAVCTACDASCATCGGGAANECLSCFSGYSFAGGSCTDDDECAAMTDNCDANATCTNTAGSFTCVCNGGFSGDGESCTAVCSPAPLACRSAEKSILVVRDKADDSRDRLVWKWIKGEATTQGDVADPTDSAHYSLCLYAGASAALIAEAVVLPDATKWSSISDKGFKYKDKSGAAAGLRKLLLKGGEAGKSKAHVKGKGAELADVSLPLALPVVAQLVNSETGVCFDGMYDTAEIQRNEPGRFTAKAP